MEPHFHPLQIEIHQVGFSSYTWCRGSQSQTQLSDWTATVPVSYGSSRRSSLLDSLAILWLLFPDPGLKHQVKTWAETCSKQMWVCQGSWGSESREATPVKSHTAQSVVVPKHRGRGSRKDLAWRSFRNQAEDSIIIMWESCLWATCPGLEIGVQGQISSPRRG